jgi:hypothetical protein
MQSDGVAPEAAKAAYEPPEFVEYGQASSLITTDPPGNTTGDGGAVGNDYTS